MHHVRTDATNDPASSGGQMGTPSAAPKAKEKQVRWYGSKFAALSSDEEELEASIRRVGVSVSKSVTTNTKPAWEKEYNRYVDLDLEGENIDEKTSTIQWWGVRDIYFVASTAMTYHSIDECSSFSDLGITCTRLFGNHGDLCLF